MLIVIHAIYFVSTYNVLKKLVLLLIHFIIMLCTYRGLENLQSNRRSSLFCSFVNLNEMVMCLEDLINYFAQPEEDMGKK